jgi:RES domain-containing protein
LNIWRICRQNADPKIPNGIGGQRWNSSGMPVIYAAQSRALAALELLGHLDAAALREPYSLISISVDESLVQQLDVAALPKNWRADPPPSELKLIGDDWIEKSGSPVLKVPSALVPKEYNFLLNTAHRQFGELGFEYPISFRFDHCLIKTS